jgi:CelD/BcsL family acetyltransferase involved in cellulose biosynthesis
MASERAEGFRLEAVGSFGELGSEWDELAAQTRSVFATREWLSTWWPHFGRHHTLLLAACRRPDGGLAAVLPLYLARSRPLRVARFIGHGPSDELGPICAPADRPLAARALRRALDSVRADAFLGDNLSGEARWPALLSGTVVERTASPVLYVSGRGWEEILAARSANFRQQVRRRERKLTHAGDVRFRLAEGQRLERDLSTLFSLHVARWGRRAAFAALERFHRDAARSLHEQGWLRLWFLEVDGRPVAAWYGFRFAGVESYYQAGRDPAWDHASVGFVLLAHTIREAVSDGMEEYRFLRGDERYKLRFADADPGVETVLLARGPVARLALSLRTSVRRVGLVRRLAPRLGAVPD